jgi:hypothetical protein
MKSNNQRRVRPNGSEASRAGVKELEGSENNPLLQDFERNGRSSQLFQPNLPGSSSVETSEKRCFYRGAFGADRIWVCALAFPNSPKILMPRTRGKTSCSTFLSGSQICTIAAGGTLFLFGSLRSRAASPRHCGPLYQRRKIGTDCIGNSEHQFNGRVAQTVLNQAEHGFRDARALAHRVIRQFPTNSLVPQKPDEFPANRLIMSNIGHVEALQKKGLDSYFAMVKYPLYARRVTIQRLSCAASESKAARNDGHTPHQTIFRHEARLFRRRFRLSGYTGEDQSNKLGNQAQHSEETAGTSWSGKLLQGLEMRPLISTSRRQSVNFLFSCGMSLQGPKSVCRPRPTRCSSGGCLVIPPGRIISSTPARFFWKDELNLTQKQGIL